MNKIYLKTGFSLIELIVAIVLISFVLLGIFTINNVLSNNNQDYGQRFLVKSETQATLNNILNNASLAVGSVSSSGILIGAQLSDADPNSFCIHQGPNSNADNNANQDVWLCYSLANNQITWCLENYPGTPSSCSTAITAGTEILPPSGNTQTYIGTANSITSPVVPSFANAQFTITIQNCLNNTALSCNSSDQNPVKPGVSDDPVNNPEVQITGSTATPQVSTG